MNLKITEISKEKIGTIELKDLIGESRIEINLIDHYHDNLEFELKERLDIELEDEKIYCDKPTLRYNLSCSQGSGLSWNGSGYFIYKKQKYYFNVSEGHLSNYYSHKYTNSFSITTINDNEAKDEVYKYFKDLYYNICDKIEKIGYELIELEEIENYKFTYFNELMHKYSIDKEFEYDYLVLTDDEYNKLTDEDKKKYIKFTDKSETYFELYVMNLKLDKFKIEDKHEYNTFVVKSD